MVSDDAVGLLPRIVLAVVVVVGAINDRNSRVKIATFVTSYKSGLDSIVCRIH